MKQETIDRCKEYFKRREAGESGEKLRKELHLGPASISAYKRLNKKQKPKVSTPKFVDLIQPTSQASRSVAVIVCSIDNVKSVIAGLQ